ncbi:MAG: translation initiation factor [Planctomycetota bacterium]
MRLFEGTPWDRPPRCERCGVLEQDCRCPPEPAAPRATVAPEKQTARVQCEKRARGKMVTVVRGLAPSDNDLPTLLKQLKDKCGAGGTLKEDALELQGEHRERVAKLLQEIGYRVR